MQSREDVGLPREPYCGARTGRRAAKRAAVRSSHSWRCPPPSVQPAVAAAACARPAITWSNTRTPLSLLRSHPACTAIPRAGPSGSSAAAPCIAITDPQRQALLLPMTLTCPGAAMHAGGLSAVVGMMRVAVAAPRHWRAPPMPPASGEVCLHSPCSLRCSIPRGFWSPLVLGRSAPALPADARGASTAATSRALRPCSVPTGRPNMLLAACWAAAKAAPLAAPLLLKPAVTAARGGGAAAAAAGRAVLQVAGGGAAALGAVVSSGAAALGAAGHLQPLAVALARRTAVAALTSKLCAIVSAAFSSSCCHFLPPVGAATSGT